MGCSGGIESTGDLKEGSIGTSSTSASKVSISISESELDIEPISEFESSALRLCQCCLFEDNPPKGIQQFNLFLQVVVVFLERFKLQLKLQELVF